MSQTPGATPPFQEGALPLGVSAETLSQLAAARPDLWPQISKHPNCYDGLRQWIADREQEHRALRAAPPQTEPLPLPPPQTLPQTPPWTLPQIPPQTLPVAQPARQLPPQTGAYPAFGQPPGVAPSGMPMVGYPPGVSVNPSVPVTAGATVKKKRGIPAIAWVAVVALVLGGSGIGLAMTDTWPFGVDGPVGQLTGWSVTTGSQTPAPSFADGLETRWTVTGDDLGPEARLTGHLPRMMGPINYASRPDQPIQIEAGVLLHYNPTGRAESGDVPASWALLNPRTGAPVWKKEGWGYANSCATNAAVTEAACSTSFVSGSKLISLDEEGIQFNEDSEYGAVAATANGWVVQGGNTVEQFSERGEIQDQQSVAGVSAATVSNAENPGCVWFFAAATVSYGGASCEAPADEVLTTEESFNWTVIDEDHPKILIDEVSRVRLFDAASRKLIWSVEGATLPGWYAAPMLASTKNGEALLLQHAEDNASSYSLVNLETADDIPFVARGGDAAAVIANNEVLIFGSDPLNSGSLNHVTVFDPETGEQKAEYDIPAIDNAAELIGGPLGVLIGHQLCIDCSTAEGSHVIDSYTFLAPAPNPDDAGQGNSTSQPGATATAGTERHGAPDAIPACPANTILLAWAELQDGWVLVCGVSIDQPSYAAYQSKSALSGPSVSYSQGSNDPTGRAATSAVTWDESLKRYTAIMEDNTQIVLDYTVGTVTQRNSATSTDPGSQQRFVRYVFVPLGGTERTSADFTNESGAFDVNTPDETAEDQVRYMYEVLIKAQEGRSKVRDAWGSLRDCVYGRPGIGNYGGVVTEMEQVRDNRKELLQALDAMPVDKIPQGDQLLAELSYAIELAYSANKEQVKWANRVNDIGCPRNLSTRGNRAADQSEDAKKQFVKRWNRVIAPQYDVTTFEYSNI